MTTQVFYRKVMDATGRGDREAARRATAAVLRTLRDRLTPEEGDDLVAQLPRELQRLWNAAPRAGRRPLKMHRQEFYERVMEEAQVPSLREARELTLAVFGALKGQVTPGEAEDVLAQLPRDLKDVWVEAAC